MRYGGGVAAVAVTVVVVVAVAVGGYNMESTVSALQLRIVQATLAILLSDGRAV